MLYPDRAAQHLTPELFRHPAAAYRSLPFWSWNCRVTREIIDRQVGVFARMGFGGVVIHPRIGLDIPYLGPEFMELVRYAVERCRAAGLICWLYDDDRFPSGAAGGQVTRDPQFRQRFLLVTEEEQTQGTLRARYAVGEDGVRRLEAGEAPRPGERLRRAYVMELEPRNWFQGQTYVDIMNPAATDRFLALTHEAYARTLGPALGTAAPAIFTDEPRMETSTRRYQMRLRSAADRADVAVPWSEPLEERLRQRGIDLLEILPALLWELPGSAAARWTFRDAAGEQFVSAFLDRIADWCAAHHVLMTGHVLSEDSLFSQSASLGDCMRCYRRMDVPGIDVLCDDRTFLAAKQAVSVAHQYGREAVASELYGVTRWSCSFKTFKLQGDWQAALGVTARVPHLSWMSMEGEAKRDWPGSIFEQAPWWREYRSLEDYFARLNTALTRGAPGTNVAVIHPVESMWLLLGCEDQTLEKRRALDQQFDGLLRALLLHLIDFDLIAESLLPGQQPRYEDGCLHIGPMTYRTVIVPALSTLRSTTLQVLEAFRAAGGEVIFAAPPPALVDAKPDPRAAELAARCSRMEDIQALCGLLRERAGLWVDTAEGRPADQLLVQRRREEDGEWIFLCHAWPSNTGADAPERYTLRLRGAYRLTCYDALTGDIRPLPAEYRGGDTVYHWTAYAQDSLLLRLTPGRADLPVPMDPVYRPYLTLAQPDRVAFSEPNMLLLDYARARLDGGPETEKTEILRLDNLLRARLGFALRGEDMMQPYALEEKETHRLELRYTVFSQTEAACMLALEHPGNCRVTLNGQPADPADRGWYVDRAIRAIALPTLRKGENELRVALPYHQKTNLENMYLLGDFDVRPRAAGESAVLPGTQKNLGDLTAQGMPFYSGEAIYSFAFSVADAGEYALRVTDFAAALCAARVDGRSAGQIAYAPHRVSLGCLEAGMHRLEITAFIGRQNGFECLHNAREDYVWYGPAAWRTAGADWTDDYRLQPAGLTACALVERVCRKPDSPRGTPKAQSEELRAES